MTKTTRFGEIPAVPSPCSRAVRLEGRVDQLLSTGRTGPKGFPTTSHPCLTFDHEGIVDNRHRGWTRAADARVPYLPRGTIIRNERQVSIVAIEDMAEIASRLDIARLDPAWLGANIVVAGVAHLSWLPRGTRLFTDGGAVLIVTDQNAPCMQAGAEISRQLPDRRDITFAFARRAEALRGVVATVEHAGAITSGSTLSLRLPAQWLYPVTTATPRKVRTKPTSPREGR